MKKIYYVLFLAALANSPLASSAQETSGRVPPLQRSSRQDEAKRQSEVQRAFPLLAQRSNIVWDNSNPFITVDKTVRVPSKITLKPKAVPSKGTATPVTIWGNPIYDQAWSTTKQFGVYTITPAADIPLGDPLILNKGIKNIGGAAIVDGVYYKISADLTYSAYGIVFENLYAYDTKTWQPASGNGKSLNDWSLIAVETAQAKDGTVYGVFFTPDLKGYQFGVIDYKNLTRTTFGTTTKTYGALGITSDNRLYGIAQDGNLYKIDTTDGTETLVGPTGVNIDRGGNQGIYNQTGEIDQRTNTFYWAAVTGDMQTALYTVDLNTGAATKIGDYNDGITEYVDFVIPKPEAEDDAPAVATDLGATFDGPSTSGTLTFTAPTSTFGGDDLTGDLTYTVSDNDSVIATGTTTPGAVTTVALNDLQEGENNIVVITNNGNGDSPKAQLAQWVGYDVPDKPSDVTLQVDNNNNATVNWQAPTTTLHNGYLGDLTYEVTRSDGHDEAVVASGLTSTSYSEQIPEAQLGHYSYKVRAVNGDTCSDYAQSNIVMAGSAYEVPYLQTFDDASSMDFFTTVDANNDGSGWVYDQYNKLVYYNGLRARVNADDWLITPPIHLTGGKTYRLSFEAYNFSTYPERLEVKYGKSNTVDAMTQTLIGDTTLSDGVNRTLTSEVTPDADGSYYFGFHAISDAHNFYLNVDSIAVDAVTTESAPDSVTEAKVTPGDKGALTATISFRAPQLSVDGGTLTRLDSIDVKKGSNIVGTIKNPVPGSVYSVTDTTAYNGSNSYVVTAYNASGAGNPVTVSAFIGLDSPKTPTGLSIKDNQTSVNLNWSETGNTGVNGGYVDPAEVTSTLYSMKPSNNGYVIDQELTSVTGANAIDYAYNTNEGDPQLSQWGVANKNASGTSDAAVVALPVGKPYSLPFFESFPKGSSRYSWWVQRNGIQNWSTSSAGGDDADRGYGTLRASAGDDATLNSFKISLEGTTNPELVFSNLATPGSNVEFTVTAQTSNGDTTEVYNEQFANETGNADWHVHKVSLKQFAGSKWVILSFRADATDADIIGLDRIYVEDVPTDNLSASVKSPSIVTKGQPANIKVTVENFGDNTATGYTVKVRAAGKEVFSEKQNGTLESFAKQEIPVAVPTSSVDPQQNSLAIEAEVIADNDANSDDNIARDTIALVNSSVPTVGNVTLSDEDGSNVGITWTAPETESHEVTEEFDEYEPYSIDNVGSWTLTDANGGATVAFGGASFPHAFEPYSFMVFNPTDLGINVAQQSQWNSHSGDQYMISFVEDVPRGVTPPVTDHWLISPELSGEAQTISFYAAEPTFVYGNETAELLYSTTGTDISDFTSVKSINVTAVPDGNHNWGEAYTFDVPQGATHFAIRHTSRGIWALMLDDITYQVDAGAPVSYNIYRDGTLIGNVEAGDDLYFEDADASGANHIYSVTVVYPDGQESEPVEASYTTGIENVIANAKGKPFDIYTVDGKLVRRQATSAAGLAPGLYVIGNNKVVVK